MDAIFISAFVYSLEKMMRSMLNSACHPAGPGPVPLVDEYVSGVVYFTGTVEGRVTLSTSRSTAQGMVAEILGTKPSKITRDMLQDGLAEMANIIAGNAKALLADTRYRVQMSLPRVVLGQSSVPGSHSFDKAHCRRFSSPHGQLSLSVWLVPQHPSAMS